MAGLEIGSVVRTQDIMYIKQNEDNKASADQTHISQTVNRQTESNATEVVNPENADYYNKKQDASEKGKNEYAGDGGKNRRNGGGAKPKDQVIKKAPQGGFDIKI